MPVPGPTDAIKDVADDEAGGCDADENCFAEAAGGDVGELIALEKDLGVNPGIRAFFPEMAAHGEAGALNQGPKTARMREMRM